MRFLDAIVESSFKKDDSGNTLFYPWGVLGSGFVLGSTDKEHQVRLFITRMYWVLLLIFVVNVAVESVGLFLVIPPYCLWYLYKVRKITRDLARSNEELKLSESLQVLAKAFSLPALIFFGLLSLGFVLAGIWLFTTDLLVSSLTIGFFGFCALFYGYMIAIKIKKSH